MRLLLGCMHMVRPYFLEAVVLPLSELGVFSILSEVLLLITGCDAINKFVCIYCAGQINNTARLGTCANIAQLCS